MLKVCGKDIKIEGRLLRIARLDEDKYQSPEDPAALIDGLRKARTRIDLFTFLQKPPECSPKYDYDLEWDNLAVLPVSTFDHWFTHQIRSLPRNRARQAGKKGVVVREVPFDDALLKGICDIYSECPIRQGRRFPHYGMTFDKARQYAGTYLERSIFIGAFFENTLIGFVKLTCDEMRAQACLVHILSMVQHKDKAPTNALLAQAVRSCADRSIGRLIYQNFSYGKRQGDSLSHFKEINGFQRIDLPRYYIPLTRMGRAAFHLGLHHRMADHIPETVAVKLRQLRTMWYRRKVQEVTES